MRALLVVALTAGCSSRAAIPPRPLGVQDHLAEAERHDADATGLEARAASRERVGPPPTAYSCGDQAVADQTTSGGERLGGRAPCWSGEGGAVDRDRATAARLRADARDHRVRARALVRSEHAWCADLPAAELEHTPFDHHEDVVAVSAELDGDRLRGARIRFARVPQLTAEWLRQTLTCHAAIAAAGGYAPALHATCPAVVAGAETTVIDDPAGLVVVIHADDPAAAITIYARAEALLDARHDGHGH